jgi:membrane protein
MKQLSERLNNKIWSVERASLSFIKRISLSFTRVIYLTIKKSQDHQIFLRASALTLFSLLAIVPVLASLFGIAKGFGLAEVVESQIRKVFYAQEQVMDLLLAFSERSLEHAKGGVIAGVGIFFLIYTVVRMIGNVESAFNTIWDTDKSRTILRKFTDYLFILILTPFLLVFSSSASLSFLTEFDALLVKIGIPSEVSATVEIAIQIIPQLLLGLSFGFVYSFLPNTTVKLTPALIGGLMTAGMFILAQSAYIELQVALTSYGVIYGSFAALPLFIIWLQVAWILVLLGAEITRAIEIRDDYEFLNGKDELSIKKLLEAVAKIGETLKNSIESRDGALNTHQLSKASGLSKRATRYACYSLKRAKIITLDKENNWIPVIPTQDLVGPKITEIFAARGITF